MKQHRKQSGLSLIELMIALLIGSILLLGVLQLLSRTTSNDRVNNALARTQESARIAIEFIQRDARRANYLGCANANQPAADTPTSAQTAIETMLVATVTGTEGANGSDTLSLSYASNTGATLTNIANNGISFTPEVSHAANETFMFTDCTNVAVIKTNSSSNSTGSITSSGNEYDPRGINPYTQDNATGNSVPVTLWQMANASYSIRDTGRTNSNGDPIMGLFRNNDEIIEGAENLQILYGLASSPTTTRWVDADGLTAANSRQVYRIKVSIVVAYPDPLINAPNGNVLAVADLNNPTLAAANDGRLRRAFTSEIDIRNRQHLRN